MTFPAIIPSSRKYQAGEYPNTPHVTLSGGEVRVRHSNEPIDAILELFFSLASATDRDLIIAHYGAAGGNFRSFVLSPEVLSGIDDEEDLTPAEHLWAYESFPSIADVPIVGDTSFNLHDIAVRLRSVPPEPVVALGARLQVNVSAVGGFAYDADAYWSSWVEQNYGWYAEGYAAWWAT